MSDVHRVALAAPPPRCHRTAHCAPPRTPPAQNIVQLLLEMGVFSEPDLLDLLSQCLEAHKESARRAGLRWHDENTGSNQKTLEAVISDCSKQLEPLGMKVAPLPPAARCGGALGGLLTGAAPRRAQVARTRSRVDKTTYYGVVNILSSDPFAQLANSLNAKEREFFHVLEREMSAKEKGSLEAMEATSLGRELSGSNKMTATEAQDCLQRLVQGQWLAMSNDGYYSLGIRCDLQQMYRPRPEAPQPDTSQAAASQVVD